MLDDVGERLGDDEVGGRLDVAAKTLLGHFELHGQG
jgi:hypothetical protein